MEELVFSIATGSNRLEKTFKNRRWTWKKFVDHLRGPVRTPETVQQFADMPKDKRASLKDQGGFIGGYLEDGSRKKVKTRQLVCLDIDFARSAKDIWETVKLIGYTAAMYSTHSHRPDHVRLRLVVPLLKEIPSEQYQPVARKIAFDLGMELFDDTTYEPQRIMFWPSCPKDGEYLFFENEGVLTDPDALLDEYDDWTDASQWPVSERDKGTRLQRMEQMQPIEEKRGVIGAFLRCRDLHEIITEFLPDVYERVAGDSSRYTYTGGSTHGGMVVYNDTFAYSHHDTDPAQGRELNGFDLVRIHKFGALDVDCDSDTPLEQRPSYMKMMDFAKSDRKTRAQLKKEEADQMKDTLDGFDEEDPAHAGEDDYDPTDESWLNRLEPITDRKGTPLRIWGSENRYAYKSTARNLELIFAHDPQLRGVFGFDEFRKMPVALKDLPWRKVKTRLHPEDTEDNALKDMDDSNLRALLEKRYGIKGKDLVFDAVNNECNRNTVNPVKEYLDGLVWDGNRRVESLMFDFFGVDPMDENTALYVKAVTKKWFLAAVKRIFQPGCKFDNMLVLKGTQGTGKSTFFFKLSKGWFTDSLPNIQSKDSQEGLLGTWIIELAEMSALKKADAEGIKAFISRQKDNFRMAYGRRTQEYPRQCVFAATTNEGQFLNDLTGNRRYWIVEIPKNAKPKKDIFTEFTEAYVDQLWAETVAIYKEGTENLVLSEQENKAAQEIQKQFMQEEPYAVQIVEALGMKIPLEWDDMSTENRVSYYRGELSGYEGVQLKMTTCAAEIWQDILGHTNLEKMDRMEAIRINKIMDSLPDWKKSKNPIWVKGYGKVRGFVRITD